MIRISILMVIGAVITTPGDVRAAEPALVELVPPDQGQYWAGQRIAFAIDLPRARLLRAASHQQILIDQLVRLQEALIGHGLPWNGHELAERLRHFRRSQHAEWRRRGTNAPLSPLNPSRSRLADGSHVSAR